MRPTGRSRSDTVAGLRAVYPPPPGDAASTLAGRVLASALGIPRARQPQARLHRLSAREQQVVWLVSLGADNRTVAAALGVSESTVKGHLRSVQLKLGLTGRVGIAVWAMRHLS